MIADKKLSEYNAFGVQRRNPLNFFGTFGLAFLYVLVVALFVFNYLTVTRVAVLENEVENLKQTLSGVRLLDDNLIRDIIGFDDDDEVSYFFFLFYSVFGKYLVCPLFNYKKIRNTHFKQNNLLQMNNNNTIFFK